MKIEKFEDLPVWKEARKLVGKIYTLTNTGLFSKDFGLRDQIQRSSVSILSNIAEGFERENNKEFILYLKYAKGSAGEVRAQLYIALDIGYIRENEFKLILENIISISKQLSSFRKYLKANML
jgi:four helix bundle protein